MNQKTIRKLLSFLLALAMVVGLVPGISLTAYAADANGLWVNTEQATSSDVSGTGWSYDATANKLTLNNYNFSGVGSAPPADKTVIMYYPQDKALTIELQGNNKIVQGDGSTEKTWWGIYSRSDLIIQGNGTLDISTSTGYRGAAIYCEKDITIKGGTIIAKSGEVTQTDLQGSGICGPGTLTIEDNAKVTMIGPNGGTNMKVINEIPGMGWTDIAGTQGQTVIEASTSDQTLTAYYYPRFRIERLKRMSK